MLIQIFRADTAHACPLPEFLASVSAGFPSPADDYIEKRLDLNELIIKHPHATFFVRVAGDSMRDAGILSGDILVVDRAIAPSHGKIVVAVINGKFTVKRIHIDSQEYVNQEADFQVWGVVTYVIHKVQ